MCSTGSYRFSDQLPVFFNTSTSLDQLESRSRQPLGDHTSFCQIPINFPLLLSSNINPYQWTIWRDRQTLSRTELGSSVWVMCKEKQCMLQQDILRHAQDKGHCWQSMFSKRSSRLFVILVKATPRLLRCHGSGYGVTNIDIQACDTVSWSQENLRKRKTGCRYCYLKWFRRWWFFVRSSARQRKIPVLRATGW